MPMSWDAFQLLGQEGPPVSLETSLYGRVLTTLKKTESPW